MTVTMGECEILLSPELLNWAADPVVAIFTYIIVGLHYISRSDPAWGSVLYMVFYVIHIALLFWILSIYPTIWLMVLIGIIYIGLHIAAVVLKNVLD